MFQNEGQQSPKLRLEMAETSEVDAWKRLEETPAVCEVEAGVPRGAGKPVVEAFPLRKQFGVLPQPPAGSASALFS